MDGGSYSGGKLVKGSEEQWMLVKDNGVGKAVSTDDESKREMVDEINRQRRSLIVMTP